MKSEPEAYSWTDLVRQGRGRWDGVRNHAAAANLRAMKVGDSAIFYHSVQGKEAVGIMKIARAAYPDPTYKIGVGPKGNWVAVDVVPVRTLDRPVSLVEMKKHPVLKHMQMMRQGRLSVVQLTTQEWRQINRLSMQSYE